MSNIAGTPPANFNAEDYNRYVKYYLETEVSGIVYNLDTKELNSFFEMVTKYPTIVEKVFLMPGDALINYIIYGNEFYKHLKVPSDQPVDYTPSEIVKLYKNWAVTHNIPVPEDMVVKEGLNQTPMIEFQKNL